MVSRKLIIFKYFQPENIFNLLIIIQLNVSTTNNEGTEQSASVMDLFKLKMIYLEKMYEIFFGGGGGWGRVGQRKLSLIERCP